MKSMGVVLKIVERCNINCTYCYMFNLGDESYKRHPPYISLDTIVEVSSFLKKGCIDLKIDHLVIEFHGGEPLMIKKMKFDSICKIFTKELEPFVNLEYALQTNGMLLDDEWIDLFYKHEVGIGISIDGIEEYHDKNRLDHKGGGTHRKVVEKIRLFQRNPISQGKLGVLCVINPEHDARKIYRHFVDDLKVTCMDFLLPYLTHDFRLGFTPEMYGSFLCNLLEEWAGDDNPDIRVRILNSVINLFLGGESYIYGHGPGNNDELPLISISTNGELSPTDELRATSPSINYCGDTVGTTSLAEYLQRPVFGELHKAQVDIPIVCKSCCWQSVCGGGPIVSRFSKINNFDNPSIYCEGLKNFYSQVAIYLLRNGYSLNKMIAGMGIK